MPALLDTPDSLWPGSDRAETDLGSVTCCYLYLYREIPEPLLMLCTLHPIVISLH
jgi:hypothetical protein